VLSPKTGLSLHLDCHEGLLTWILSPLLHAADGRRACLESETRFVPLFFVRECSPTVRNVRRQISVGLEFSSLGNRRKSPVGVLEYQIARGQPVLSPKKGPFPLLHIK
jgi:hypothetical protein